MKRWNFTSEFSLIACKTPCIRYPGLSGSPLVTILSWRSTWETILAQMPRTMINARPRTKISKRNASLKLINRSIWWNTASIKHRRSSNIRKGLWNWKVPTTKKVKEGYLDWGLSMKNASNNANSLTFQSLMSYALGTFWIFRKRVHTWKVSNQLWPNYRGWPFRAKFSKRLWDSLPLNDSWSRICLHSYFLKMIPQGYFIEFLIQWFQPSKLSNHFFSSQIRGFSSFSFFFIDVWQ